MTTTTTEAGRLQPVKRKKKRNAVAVSRIRGKYVFRTRIEETDPATGVKSIVQRAIAFADAEGRADAPIPKNILDLAREEIGKLKGKTERQRKQIRHMRVTAFYEEVFLPELKEMVAKKGMKPSTLNGYQGMWRRYVEGTDFSGLWLRDITTLDVRNLLDEIACPKQVNAKAAASRHGFGPRVRQVNVTTFKHIKAFLSGLCRYAAEKGMMDSSNPVKPAKIPSGIPKGNATAAYGAAEMTRMLNLLSGCEQTVVAVAAFSGLRCGEIAGLRWSDYVPADQESGQLGRLHVRRSIWRGVTGDPKTTASADSVPIVPQLAEYLESWRRACGNRIDGPIFENGSHKPISLDSLYWRKIRPVLTKAEIRWSGYHGFRRGLATLLNAHGIDDSVIQLILRHADIGTTRKCYIKPFASEADSAMRQAGVVFSTAWPVPEATCSSPVLEKDDRGRVQ